MPKETITAHVRKNPDGTYRGYITVWNGGAKMYNDSCIILRTSRLDAKSDALRAISEIEAISRR